MRRWQQILGGLAVTALLGAGGCPDADEIEDILDELDEIEIEIEQNVNNVQTVVPVVDDLPDDVIVEGDTIIIADDAVVVTDISETLVIEELPDITLVGFENFTGLDGYYEYLVDGEFQSIYVFADETLFIEYPCLFDIELLYEEYFEPCCGTFVFDTDLSGTFFVNPDDFLCGDAFIMTFTLDDIFVDIIPLVD
jgi:hypothetical protein